MKPWLLEHLVCPHSREPLQLREARRDGEEIVEGTLFAPSTGRTYPVVAGIPRFVQAHYAQSFALQWTLHKQTQFDNLRHQHSAQNFWGKTGFTAEGLRGRLVMDAGCGSGRYSQVAAAAGATVVAVDLSEAVDAAADSLRKYANVTVVQASLFDLPFPRNTFDAVFCLGVIQHTPDPLRCLASIAEVARGALGLYWYKKYWWTYAQQKYLLRPFASLMDNERLYRFVRWYVPKLLPVSRLMVKLPYLGPPYNLSERILPIANRDYIGDFTDEEKTDWAVLDTFDWYSPRYDKPQSWSAVQRTLQTAGFAFRMTPMRGLRAWRVRGAPDSVRSHARQADGIPPSRSK